MSKTESTAVNELISLAQQPISHSSANLGDELQFDRKPPAGAMPRPRAAGTAVHSVGGAPRSRTSLPPPIPGKATLFGAAVTRSSTKMIVPPAIPKPADIMADVDVTVDFAPVEPEHDPRLSTFDMAPSQRALGSVAGQGANHRTVEPVGQAGAGLGTLDKSEEFEREAATFLRRPDSEIDSIGMVTARRSAPMTLDGTPLERQFSEKAAPNAVLYEDSSVMSSAPWSSSRAVNHKSADSNQTPASLANAQHARGRFDEDRWHEFTGSNHYEDAEPTRFTLGRAKKWIAPIAGISLVAAFAVGYFYFNQKADAGPTAAVSPTAAAPVAVAAIAVPAAPAVAANAAPTAPESVPAPVAQLAAIPAPVAPAAVAAVPLAVPVAVTPAPVAPGVIPAPVAVAAPTVEDARKSLVNVRFESRPSGATITLLQGGRSTLIGATPMVAEIDSRVSYDAVFAIEGRETKLKHFAPREGAKVKVELRSARKSRSNSRSERRIASSAKNVNQSEVAAGSNGGIQTVEARTGTLMIATKPPCDIAVNGKPTGLMTPQRNIMLKPGAHKITLSNGANGIKKQIAVTVVAGRSTKVVQDYSSLIRR